ncbi:LysR family transcriptional regulator [Tateyamaria omphalii]|uniref:LysR family transcriptional regulator n=1 Tax=Tateyamaria omphalii TaxID=299262 RepID=A0A1P8MXJ1_9RHOB|nr:LysR family transcriptional regulator [Tateyamaria omphalii]APX12712.1 LysR family transcriptional regulator [Tateyamaria omphalii]
MDWRDLPPLAALRAFAAFVDTGSVVAAGHALSVSHAAVSQQLRALEAHLGVSLFDRSGRAMKLTEDGEILAQGCADGFGSIARAVALVTGAEAARPLHISPTPSFAAAWLMPRLSEFRTKHPAINLMLNPTSDIVALTPGGVDLSIRYGVGGWDGLDSELLVPTSMVVVAAPHLVAGRDVSDPANLGALPWLEEIGTTESSRWLTQRGAANMARGPVTQVPGNLMLDGARDGQGVAVTVRNFVNADIVAGRLVVLHEDMTEGAGYYLVTRPGIQRPALRDFIRWIRKAARA